jgi:DNA primase
MHILCNLKQDFINLCRIYRYRVYTKQTNLEKGDKMAYYSEDIIEEVKNANDIVDVVSSYVTLKRSGGNFFGLCPFHREKTPSFSVSPDRQIFHCFGCGEGGNVIRFISRIENLGFKETIEHLAERARIDLPISDFDGGMDKAELIKRENQKKQMYLINAEAGKFFYSNIEKSKVALAYIEKRKLDSKTVAKFGLGFSLDDNGLYKYLLKLGFSEIDILATGLANKNDKGYINDRFKNRFMFPIFDIRDKVIGFGGRVLDDSLPKYVNSPENLIYSKGKHLFALNFAKKTSAKMKRVVVVEGYMDAISLHQRGVPYVVASLGTALTEQQGRLLRQYAEDIILSYDSDDAGQKAILRGIDVMQALGCSAKVLQMEDAKDPDEYIIKFGKDRFERLIDKSISSIEFKINILRKKYNLEDTSEKIKFLNEMANVLAKIDNNIERDIYVEKISKEIGIGKEPIYAEIEKITFKDKVNIKNWEQPKPIVISQNKPEEKINDIENMLIFLLCEKNLNIYKLIKENIKIDDIEKPIIKDIIKKLYEAYEKGNINNVDIIDLFESEEEVSLITGILLQEHILDDISKVTQEVIKGILTNQLQNKKKELLIKLQNELEENERRKIESELNEVIINLAKR